MKAERQSEVTKETLAEVALASPLAVSLTLRKGDRSCDDQEFILVHTVTLKICRSTLDQG